MHLPETAARDVSQFMHVGNMPFMLKDHSPLSIQHCPYCPATFSSLRDMKAHISKDHGSAMPFSCELCGKGYETPLGLQLHMQAHQGKTHPCPVCDSKLSQKSALRPHLKKVHGVAQCVTCSGVFKLGQEYTQHVLHCN